MCLDIADGNVLATPRPIGGPRHPQRMVERVGHNLDVLGSSVAHSSALSVAFFAVSAQALGGTAMGTPAAWRL